MAHFHALQQLQNLMLNRHVQRRGGFVGDQQLRLASDRHRDHDALLLPAGKLMRVAVEPPQRIGDADFVQ